MKNIFKGFYMVNLLLSFSIILVSFGASAATIEELEQRIEALEYQGYENYTKITGSLEYRIDSVSTEYKKDNTVLNTNTGSAVTNSKGSKTGSGYDSIFFNMNIESRPSDKLSFFGKLSMAKYSNLLNNGGASKDVEDRTFNDLSRGSTQTSTDLMVERAFFNYKFTKTFTFTAGRLPTSHGAPRHFSEGSTRRGNYPIVSFGGNWDGVAGTYNLNEDSNVKFIYNPVQQLMIDNLSQNVEGNDGKTVNGKVPAYTLLYEYHKANVFGSKQFYFIGSYFSVKEMPTLTAKTAAGSNLKMSLQRTSFYTEFSRIANSNFDFAMHGVYSSTKSEGKYTSTYGWLTNKDKETNTGTGLGLLTRYNLGSSQIGYEYFTSSKNLFLFDPSSQSGVSIYTTAGDAHHLFFNQKFEGGFKVVVGSILQNNKYSSIAYGLLGERVDADIVSTNTYARFIANF
jgi:hypothetical protein